MTCDRCEHWLHDWTGNRGWCGHRLQLTRSTQGCLDPVGPAKSKPITDKRCMNCKNFFFWPDYGTLSGYCLTKGVNVPNSYLVDQKCPSWVDKRTACTAQCVGCLSCDNGLCLDTPSFNIGGHCSNKKISIASYDEVVKALHPIAYWKMDETPRTDKIFEELNRTNLALAGLASRVDRLRDSHSDHSLSIERLADAVKELGRQLASIATKCMGRII